ncbi:MAG: RDD family protein [Candidatus Limnocylindria bacterium]
MPRRLVAFIIDVVLAVIAVVGFGILLAIVLAVTGTQIDVNDPTTSYMNFVLTMVVTAGYFILAWRQRRATLGQKWLGLIVGNQADGERLTWGAATIRWLLLTLGPIPTLITLIVPSASGLVVLLAIGWWIALLVTTAISPTKQGLHDQWSQTLVVRRT